MVIRYFGILLPAFILILAGCAAQNTGYGPHFSPIEKHIRKIAIISPDLYVYDVSGGGVPEFRTDWSKSAETSLSHALRLQLEKKDIEGIDATELIDTALTDTILPMIKLIISSIQNIYMEMEHLSLKSTPSIITQDRYLSFATACRPMLSCLHLVQMKIFHLYAK